MSKYTKDDILNMVEEEDVRFIRLQFTDILGTMKKKRNGNGEVPGTLLFIKRGELL